MSSSFGHAWRDRSIFVTGHTGFKGSWLAIWLSSLGARVTGYALAPPTEPSNFVVSNVRRQIHRHHEADIRDERSLHPALLAAQPDVIFHLAAQSIVRKSYDIPRETFDVNVMGTACLLDGVRKLHRPCAVVVVTSDKCYQNSEQVWGYREDDAMGERDPYGGSKGAAELLIRAYRHSFFPPERIAEHGVRLASARAGNVLGGGDWTPAALVVDVVRALAEGRTVEVRSPGAFRPWQHVIQALSGYLTLAGRLLEPDASRFCSGWNIGPLPGSDLPVRDVVESIMRAWGSGSWRDVSDPRQPHEARVLRLAIDKAIWELGWRPAWNLDETLRRTVEWYRLYYEGGHCMEAVCREQIEAYEENTFTDSGSPSPEQRSAARQERSPAREARLPGADRAAKGERRTNALY